MRADIHDGQEHQRSTQGPDTEAQDQSSPDHQIPLATHGRSIQMGQCDVLACSQFGEHAGIMDPDERQFSAPYGRRKKPSLRLRSECSFYLYRFSGHGFSFTVKPSGNFVFTPHASSNRFAWAKFLATLRSTSLRLVPIRPASLSPNQMCEKLWTLPSRGQRPRRLPFLKSNDRILSVEPPMKSDDELATQLARLGETDTDNTQRFATRFGARVLNTPGRGWLVYDGKRWREDDIGQVVELAKQTARLIADELEHLESDTARAGLTLNEFLLLAF